ncbi:ubiquinone biosynthesis protein [Pelagibaculum spongiae]|uniref:Ubiquinone biosynthesis protein n=1 Tax=Pelagibaculum spongiae TaxID=2080658 RepID=A0A2V1GY11_9GAMM|nr:ubiquinone biosynthesis protein [Pelagibaculum spongiae]PVZ65444.1 ubiquinone biosynthesis protein [Pelagibaculum spongiae]
MSALFQLIFSWPAVLLTVPVMVALVYWMLAFIGVLDIDLVDADIDIDMPEDVGAGFSGLLYNLGLSGVPLPLSISLWLIFAWVPTLYASQWLMLQLVDGGLFSWLIGAAILLVSIVIALPITVIAIKPLVRFYTTHEARSNQSVCGEVCKITSLEVSETFGQAALEDGGAGLILKVRSKTPNQLKKGSKALIVEYDEPENSYWILESEEESTLHRN